MEGKGRERGASISKPGGDHLLVFVDYLKLFVFSKIIWIICGLFVEKCSVFSLSVSMAISVFIRVPTRCFPRECISHVRMCALEVLIVSIYLFGVSVVCSSSRLCTILVPALIYTMRVSGPPRRKHHIYCLESEA